jgi:UDP-glucose 4-epimerase
MNKILILGGAGFIGTHLAKRYLTEGDEVIIIDSLVTSSKPVGGCVFIESRVQDLEEEKLLKLFTEADLIYHLAGSVGVEYVDKNPSETIFNNLELANYLVPLFEKAQTKVIFSSTSEVYGDKPSGDFRESDNCSIPPSTKLRWGYAASKMMTEFMFSASSFPYNIVRFFNIVGPGQVGDFGMVVPRFINAARTGSDLIIFGDGSQIRCFCHVKDAIEMIYRIGKSDTTREIFNIGNNSKTTINELANEIIRVTKSHSQIKYMEYAKVFSKHHGDILRRVPNTEKIINFTNYKPKYELVDIIEAMT